jgi:lysyl-tRNA synthetase class I
MKSVIQELTQEIEYLSALAEMYRQGCNDEAQAAALEARASLERLVNVIDDSTNKGCPEFHAAA